MFFVPQLPRQAFPYLPQPNQQALQNQLISAITYGSEHEMGMLIDRALSAGARLDAYHHYESHPLVMAVRANKPWAVSILMARGLELPPVPASGTDLLMDACKSGHSVMAKALIDVAFMQARYTNADGLNALHFAVLSGCSETVRVLVQSQNASTDLDASCDARYFQAEVDIFTEAENFLPDDQVTALTIAAMLGHADIAELLLAAGADATAGCRSPLAIAVRKGHPEIVEALIRHDCDVNQCCDENDYTGLQALIFPETNLECLRLIVPHIRWDSSPYENYSPIIDAICNDVPTIVPLLLAAGAPVEDHSDDDDCVWNQAANHESRSETLLDLLTASLPAAHIAGDTDAFCELLNQVVEHHGNRAKIASLGLFASLIRPAEAALQTLHEEAAEGVSLTMAQTHLRAALILRRTLPDVGDGTQQRDAVSSPDVAWLRRAVRDRINQRTAILDAVNRVIERSMATLTAATKLDFFRGCKASALNDPGQTVIYMESELTDTAGLPKDITRIIKTAWSNSSAWVREWNVGPTAQIDQDRFIVQTAQNLIRSQLEDLDVEGDEALAACQQALARALPAETSALRKFCGNPLVWLRDFERQHHLRRIDADGLMTYLQIALGLPSDASQTIANAWRAATTAPQPDRSLALSLDGVFQSDIAGELVPLSDRSQLAEWIGRHTREARAAEKRPAENEHDDTPLQRKPRQQ